MKTFIISGIIIVIVLICWFGFSTNSSETVNETFQPKEVSSSSADSRTRYPPGFDLDYYYPSQPDRDDAQLHISSADSHTMYPPGFDLDYYYPSGN